MKKTARQLERYFKGVANHRRIEILFLISKNEGITVDDLSRALNANFKTISQHTRSLALSGLVNKKSAGRHVGHSLSSYGKKFLRFINSFQSF